MVDSVLLGNFIFEYLLVEVMSFVGPEVVRLGPILSDFFVNFIKGFVPFVAFFGAFSGKLFFVLEFLTPTSGVFEHYLANNLHIIAYYLSTASSVLDFFLTNSPTKLFQFSAVPMEPEMHYMSHIYNQGWVYIYL